MSIKTHETSKKTNAIRFLEEMVEVPDGQSIESVLKEKPKGIKGDFILSLFLTSVIQRASTWRLCLFSILLMPFRMLCLSL